MSEQSKKILRIGIIQNGKIVEERLLRKRKPVTVGESGKNTFVVPATGLPARFPLFQLKDGKYTLTIADWMDGRISLGSQVGTLQTFKQQSIAKKVGQVSYQAPESNTRKEVPVYELPLIEKSRGKLTFGEVTLLFQFVNPPPAPVQAKRPALLKGGWLKSVDWVYSITLFVSLAAHMGFVYWCNATGPLPEVTMDMIPSRFRTFYKVAKPPEPRLEKPKKNKDSDKKDKSKDKVKDKKKNDKTKVKKKEETKVKKPVRKKTPEELAAEREARRRKMSAKFARTGFLALLGKKGKDGKGAFANVLKGGAQMEKDLDNALKGVKGVANATRERIRGPRNRGDKGIIESRSTRLVGPKEGKTGVPKTKKHKGVKVRGKVLTQEPIIEGTLNQNKLIKLINRKRRSVAYCYERELKKNPGLSGKITVQITIAKNGRVAQTEIEDNTLTATIGRCMVKRVKRWRFPKPEGDQATVSVPFVFSAS